MRSLRGLALALLLGSWLGSLAAAQPGNGPVSDTVRLERRVADLEAQVSKLLKEVQGLRHELKVRAPQPEKAEIRIFTLKRGDAVEMAKTLQDFFQAKDKALRITAEPRTNSLLVQGQPDQLDAVAAIISRLEDTETRPDAKKAP